MRVGHFCFALTVLSVVSAWTPASAQVPTAVAELNKVHIQLIDLDPSDGVTPSITFLTPAPMGFNVEVPPKVWPITHVSEAAAFGSLLTRKISSPVLPLTTAEIEAIPGDIFSSTSGLSFSARASTVAGGTAYAATWFSSVATLSPRTRMVLSAVPGDVDVSNLGSGGWASAVVSHCPVANAVVPCFDGDFNPDPRQVSDAAYDSIGSSGAASRHAALLSVTWDNLSSSSQDHWVYAAVFSHLEQPTAVPEPAACLLFGGGLALLCGLRARRARRSCQLGHPWS